MAHSASEVKWGTLATDARHGSVSVQVEAASHLARAVSSDSPAALAGAECCLGKVDLVQLAAAQAGGESPQFPPLSAADTLPLAGLAGYLLGCQRSDVQVAGLELALHCARAVGAAGSARGMAAASRLLHSGLCWQGPVVLLACLEQCCAAGDAAPPALASLHSAALQRALADKRCSSASSTARSIYRIPVPVPGMLPQALQTVQGVLQGMGSDAARLEALRAWGVPAAEGEDVWESVAVRLAHLNLGSSLALPAGPLDAPQGVQLQSKVRAAAYAWLQEAEAQVGRGSPLHTTQSTS